VPASLQARAKVGKFSNNTSKFPKIEGSYPPNRLLPVPVRRKLKNLLKLDDKKAKSSLVWLIMSDIPSFFVFFATSRINEGFLFVKNLCIERGEFYSARAGEYSSAL